MRRFVEHLACLRGKLYTGHKHHHGQTVIFLLTLSLFARLETMVQHVSRQQ